MSKPRLHAVAGAAALALAACGGSSSSTTADALCQRAVNTSSNLQQKIAPCLPPGSSASTGLPSDAQTCQNEIAQCSANDRTILSGILDCFNGLPTCSPATESQFSNQADACSAPSSGLSTACKTVTGF